MARILPPLWLLGAVLYTAATLLFVQPFQAGTQSGSLVIPFNETLRAKQPPPGDAHAALPPLPRPAIGDFRLGQWVQVAHYTAVLRAVPGSPGHVLGGYPVGEPFRVVALDGKFARVQDLGSGQFGWMRKSDLTPYTDGYRPQGVKLAPQVVAAAASVATPTRAVEQKVASAAAAKPAPAKPAPTFKRQPYALGPAPDEAPVADKPESRKPVRVAIDDSFGSILQRAFSGAH